MFFCGLNEKKKNSLSGLKAQKKIFYQQNLNYLIKNFMENNMNN